MFDDPEPLSAKLPGAPKELEDVVMRALSKKRSQRFQSMAETNDALIDLRMRFGDGTLTLAGPSERRRSRMRGLLERFRR